MSSLTIALALFHRLRTGEGQRTWDTLLGTATYLQSAEIIRFEGRPPAIVGGVDFQGDGALDRMYRAADGWVRTAAPDAPAKIASAMEIPEDKLEAIVEESCQARECHYV